MTTNETASFTHSRLLVVAAITAVIVVVGIVLVATHGSDPSGARADTGTTAAATNTVSVSGTGTVEGKPDTLVANFRVHDTESSVQAALDATSSNANKVIASLQKNGVGEQGHSYDGCLAQPVVRQARRHQRLRLRRNAERPDHSADPRRAGPDRGDRGGRQLGQIAGRLVRHRRQHLPACRRARPGVQQRQGRGTAVRDPRRHHPEPRRAHQRGRPQRLTDLRGLAPASRRRTARRGSVADPAGQKKVSVTVKVVWALG